VRNQTPIDVLDLMKDSKFTLHASKKFKPSDILTHEKLKEQFPHNFGNLKSIFFA